MKWPVAWNAIKPIWRYDGAVESYCNYTLCTQNTQTRVKWAPLPMPLKKNIINA